MPGAGWLPELAENYSDKIIGHRVSLTSHSVATFVLWISVCLPAGFAATGSRAGNLPAPQAARAVLTRTCIGCHQGANAPAGLDLRALQFNPDDPHAYGWWVRVHDAVQKGAMPPGGPKALKEADRTAFLKAISDALITHERERVVEQGRSVLRRLNRYEYEATLRDLLSAPWLRLRDSLPEDGLIGRFNKSGQALDVSHVQMARYMDTADQAMRSVLDASGVASHSQRYYVREQQRFIKRMKYTFFNSHPERATIPILGFDAQPEVITEKAPMTVGSKDPATRDLEGFAVTASTYTGNEMHFDQFSAPVGGRYRLRMNAFSIWAHTVHVPSAGDKKMLAWRPSREKTSRGRTTEPVTLYALSRGGEKRLLGSFDVTPEPASHLLAVNLLPGEQIMPDAARLFRSRPGFTGNPDASEAGTPGVAYRWLEVEGPLPTAAGAQTSYSVLFGRQPAIHDDSGRLTGVTGTAADAERLMRRFVRNAYRKPAREEEIQRPLRIVRDQLAAHGKNAFMDSLIAGYTAVLCSPGFLYLEERPGPLGSWALASRLSYFLWNAPPDQRLRLLATNGTLRRPEVLRAEAKRLLDGNRSRDFMNAFLDYWLDLRKVGDTAPDQTLYPEAYLDDLLTESSLLETQLFVDQLIRKNLPVSNIVDSKFTFLNSHLARHYGLPPVEGVAMRAVALPPDSMRGGLLTQASVLKITANGTTTSPVLRGVWIMERILGDPPPPPPPGVPAVEPDTRGATTIRQQLDKHRSIASCASCHSKIDPPGFALESFDVVGAWRDRYRSTEEGEPVQGFGKNGMAFTFRKGQPVDASGKLASGEAFADVIGLKHLLLEDVRQIARGMVKQFVVYGTGAPVTFADRPEVDRILDAAERDHYGMRSLILNVIDSKLFTNK